MKIKFKQQRFQIDAVRAVVDCFQGQPNEVSRFLYDRGRQKELHDDQVSFSMEAAFKNNPIRISEDDVLENIREVQLRNDLRPSERLEGKYNLTIEMETGERVIIVMGAVCVIKSRVSGTLNKCISCIA
jgi:type III restriction enzyme